MASAESSYDATQQAYEGASTRLALHLAVWDDNLNLLEALLEARPSLEELDARGYTPLLLSYALARTKAARMLLAAGAFPKARLRDPVSRTDTWEAIQVAALTANTDLIRHAVVAYLAETDAAFERRLPAVQAALQSLPDFEMRMQWVFSSWVPLLSRLLPSDTVTIRKRGSSLRIDTTLLQMNGLTWERGSQSLVVWGVGMPRPGSSYIMDNDAKTAADARSSLTCPTDQQQQDWVRKLITQKQKTTDFWSKDMVIRPVQKPGMFDWVSRLVVGDGVTRGRASDGVGAFAPSPIDDAPEPLVHIDSPTQLTQDVGPWRGCSVYEMQNLCVRDWTHPRLKAELPLTSWWKAEYSLQRTDAEAQADDVRSAHPPSKTAESQHDDAPEKRAGLLHRYVSPRLGCPRRSRPVRLCSDFAVPSALFGLAT